MPVPVVLVHFTVLPCEYAGGHAGERDDPFIITYF